MQKTRVSNELHFVARRASETTCHLHPLLPFLYRYNEPRYKVVDD